MVFMNLLILIFTPAQIFYENVEYLRNNNIFYIFKNVQITEILEIMDIFITLYIRGRESPPGEPSIAVSYIKTPLKKGE